MLETKKAAPEETIFLRRAGNYRNEKKRLLRRRNPFHAVDILVMPNRPFAGAKDYLLVLAAFVAVGVLVEDGVEVESSDLLQAVNKIAPNTPTIMSKAIFFIRPS